MFCNNENNVPNQSLTKVMKFMIIYYDVNTLQFYSHCHTLCIGFVVGSDHEHTELTKIFTSEQTTINPLPQTQTNVAPGFVSTNHMIISTPRCPLLCLLLMNSRYLSASFALTITTTFDYRDRFAISVYYQKPVQLVLAWYILSSVLCQAFNKVYGTLVVRSYNEVLVTVASCASVL